MSGKTKERFATIAYTRECLAVTWAENSQTAQGMRELSEENFDTFMKSIADAKTFKIEPGKGTGKDYLSAAVNSLLEDFQGSYSSLTISGFGPFDGSNGSEGLQGTVAHAHPPFDNLSIRKIAAEIVRERCREIRLITDVGAIGISMCWASWRSDTTNQQPAVIAALIIDRGIGGAIVQDFGQVMGKAYHSEMGHIPITPHKDDFLHRPQCRFHKDCLESRAGMKAIEERARIDGVELSRIKDDPSHEIWKIEADYIAQFCASIVYFAAPTQIVLSGGVIKLAPHLIDMVRDRLPDRIGNYIDYPELRDMSTFLEEVDQIKAMTVGGLLHAAKLKHNLLKVIKP